MFVFLFWITLNVKYLSYFFCFSQQCDFDMVWLIVTCNLFSSKSVIMIEILSSSWRHRSSLLIKVPQKWVLYETMQLSLWWSGGIVTQALALSCLRRGLWILLYSYATVSTELMLAQLHLHIAAPEMLINIHEGSVCELWCVCHQMH